MFFYEIEHKIFNNPYAAFLFAAHNHPHHTVKFYANDDYYSAVDWYHEPEENWHDLLTQHAQNLRYNYDRLIFLFSGGTDSNTIYNIMDKNNIFVDEIIISYADDDPSAPKQNAQWVSKNHWDQRTKITVMDKRDPRWFNQFQSNEWILQNQGGLRRLELTVPSTKVYEYCENIYGNSKWCLITGHDKPHLVFEKGQWWLTHLDRIFHNVMGFPNTEMFFMGKDPRIHMKQAHMLKRWIKNNIGDVEPGWTSVAKLGKKNMADYYTFAKACGRDSDVTLGASFWQKSRWTSYFQNDAQVLINLLPKPLSDGFLSHHLEVRSSIGRNFQQGWQSLQSDSNLVKYMLRHGLLSSPTQPINDYNGIWSKKYPLGT